MGEPARKLVESRKPGRSPIWGPVTISLAFHLLLFLTAPLFHSGNQVPLTSPRTKIVRVKVPPLEKEEIKPPLDSEGQVVDIIDPSMVTKETPDTKFLSEQNRRVDRQTQARITGPEPQPSAGAPESGDAGKINLKLPDAFLKQDAGQARRRRRVAAVAPSNYLPEIAMGDQTLLNTREYIYASFFIRMKRQMEGIWNPRRILAGEQSNRSQFVTKVSIVLRKDGRLDRVRLLASSGDRRLDQEALSAVKRAAPYLNPPPGLVGRDGRIRIPQWHFIVTMRALF